MYTSKQRTEGTIQEEVDVSYERKTVTAETSTQAAWYDIADGRATTDDTIFSTKNKRFLHPHVEKLSKFLLHSCIILLPNQILKKHSPYPSDMVSMMMNQLFFIFGLDKNYTYI